MSKNQVNGEMPKRSSLKRRGENKEEISVINTLCIHPFSQKLTLEKIASQAQYQGELVLFRTMWRISCTYSRYKSYNQDPALIFYRQKLCIWQTMLCAAEEVEVGCFIHCAWLDSLTDKVVQIAWEKSDEGVSGQTSGPVVYCPA